MKAFSYHALSVILVLFGSRSWAAEPLAVAGDRCDDPKIVRRFGAPLPVGAPVPVAVAPPAKAQVSPLVSPGNTPAVRSETLPDANVVNRSSAAHAATSEAGVGGSSPDANVATRSSPETQPWAFAPRAELTWRRLPLFRVGAQQDGNVAGKVADEGFQVLSGRLFPMSSLFRLGVAVDFGWESGQSATGGDYFLSESTSFGLQRIDRITPFLEAVAGGGLMRRVEVGVSVPTGLWFYGAEGGVDIYAVDRLYVHLSLGRMRVVNGFAQLSAISRVFEDVWAFRVGVGL
jgi:hypothetical protein